MPYPLVQWPTFEDFRHRLVDEFDCRYRDLSGQLSVNGDPVRCLERTVEGAVRRYAVVLSDDERVSPTVMRSICAQLEVDPSAFGLSLG